MIPSVALNREILLKIGEQLRVLDIVSDAVPDQFVELLARLETATSSPQKYTRLVREERTLGS